MGDADVGFLVGTPQAPSSLAAVTHQEVEAGLLGLLLPGLQFGSLINVIIDVQCQAPGVTRADRSRSPGAHASTAGTSPVPSLLLLGVFFSVLSF